MSRTISGRIAIAAAIVLSCLPAAAQTAGRFYVRPQLDFYFPLDTYVNPTTGATEKLYSGFGYGGGAALDFAATSWLVPFVRGEYVSIGYAGGSSLTSTEGDLGLGFVVHPTDRLSVRLDAMGGLAELSSSADSGAAYAVGARLGLAYRLSPGWTVSADGGYSTYLGTESTVLSAIEAGLFVSYDLSTIGPTKAKLTVESPKLDAVFPSLYAYYDENPFGSVKIVNREDAEIRDVKVSFDAGHYMDQPKVCGEYPLIAKGQSVTVPVKALFTDQVLNITQNIDAKGEIIVEYEYLGSDRQVRTPIDFQMHHRNAITWSDDRRAASFVSPTNPAALWFGKYAAGIVRDRFRGDINKPLQYAIGMFEAERLYGLNYVVVPANDFSVKHGIKDYIDSVQFPHQTLSNRGGDCSDLAILFATLMQSVGVEAAFITIPGHIFAAFDTGLDEATAKSTFYDPNLLVYRGGKAWIPVEITMVKDGFIKAWRVAAKEWADNVRAGSAAFYALPDCWKVYPPAAVPGVNPRFVLPDETDTAVAFDAALDRFVARESEPEVQSLTAELSKEKPEFRENEVGILFAHYGMLKESWKEFSDSAKADFQPAWTNLGNVAFLRQDYKLALSYYQWSYKLNPADDNALLGCARCEYELEDFDSSDAAYAELKARNPSLAGRFGYLASIFGGEGRAWSLAERASSTTWASMRVAKAETQPEPSVAAAAEPSAPLSPSAQPQVSNSMPAPSTESPVRASEVTAASMPDTAPPTISGGLPTDTESAQKAPVAPAEEKREVVAAAPIPTPSAPQPPSVAVMPAKATVPDATAPETDILVEGFKDAIPLLGNWTIEGGIAKQLDPDAFYAKLATPLVQDKRSFSYSFKAKSDAPGRGWVGVGIHVFTPKTYTEKGFGAGDSLCIWLTRDPVHLSDNITRLQLYRSTDDWNMDLLAETPVTESIYDNNRFDVTVDPEQGTVTVSLNGNESLSEKGILGLKDGVYVLFRALDRAEFSDFKAQVVK
jgi:hypothetical protein